MRIGKKSVKYLAIFAGAFPFFAILRVLTDLWVSPSVSYFYMIAQIGCSVTVMCWMLSIRKRIIHAETRHYLLMIGGFFLLYFFLQMTRYCLLFESAVVRRYMWYAYYVPMAFIPVFGVFVILCFSLPEDEHIGRRWKLLLVPAALLSVGFLTNDFHRLAFGFPDGIEWEANGRTLGPIFYANWIFMAVIISIVVYVMIHVNSNIPQKRILWYPFLPLAIGIVYIVVFSFWPELVKFGNIKLFEIAEAFGFVVIGFTEGCIQIGLIPSNTGYAMLSAMSNIPSRVIDKNGNIVFSSRGAGSFFEEDGDHYVVRVPVKGGDLAYIVDLTNIKMLNRQIGEITANLEARNELLRHENEIAEAREKSEAAIRIYDHISELVRPQILEVERLLSESCGEERFRRNLARSAVLNAYIKRRTNMELEAQKSGVLPFKELVTAVAESLEYIKLTGTETFLSFAGEGGFPAAQISRAFCAYESVAESVLGTVDYMTVRLERGSGIRIRFLLSAMAGIPDLSGLRIDGCEIACAVEDNDAELVLCVGEGGERG